MLEWLEDLFGVKRIDSSKQLSQARKQQPAQEAERLAKKLGYRNATEMMAFQRQQSQQSGRRSTSSAQAAVRQGIQVVETAHPKGVLDYVTRAMGGE